MGLPDCCLIAGAGEDKYGNSFAIPPAVDPETPGDITFCQAFGCLTVDFRKANWAEERVVRLNSRVMCGHVTVIVPADVKVDTTCAACCTGWVWCGGYMGDVQAEKSIVLCEYAWFGCVRVMTADDYEEEHI